MRSKITPKKSNNSTNKDIFESEECDESLSSVFMEATGNNETGTHVAADTLLSINRKTKYDDSIKRYSISECKVVLSRIDPNTLHNIARTVKQNELLALDVEEQQKEPTEAECQKYYYSSHFDYKNYRILDIFKRTMYKDNLYYKCSYNLETDKEWENVKIGVFYRGDLEVKNMELLNHRDYLYGYVQLKPQEKRDLDATSTNDLGKDCLIKALNAHFDKCLFTSVDSFLEQQSGNLRFCSSKTYDFTNATFLKVDTFTYKRQKMVDNVVGRVGHKRGEEANKQTRIKILKAMISEKTAYLLHVPYDVHIYAIRRKAENLFVQLGYWRTAQLIPNFNGPAFQGKPFKEIDWTEYTWTMYNYIVERS